MLYPIELGVHVALFSCFQETKELLTRWIRDDFIPKTGDQTGIMANGRNGRKRATGILELMWGISLLIPSEPKNPAENWRKPGFRRSRLQPPATRR